MDGEPSNYLSTLVADTAVYVPVPRTICWYPDRIRIGVGVWPT